MSERTVDADIAEVLEFLGEEAHAFSGATVLLTGGGGFLGTYFTAVFQALNATVLERPCELVMLDNFVIGKRVGEAPPHCRFVTHNVIDPYHHEGPLDFVIHAAGIASPFHYRAFPLETLEVATRGTRHMLELARAADARMLFFSSSEVYGDPDPAHVPTPESYRGNVSTQGPRACYDESKRLGETLCYVYHSYHGVHANAVRPFNVYGPGMGESDYRVLPNFASRIKAGRAISIYGTGRQTRTFCYVTDAVAGFLRILTRGVPGETYNIGNPKPEISMVGLVERVQEVLGRKVDWSLIEYPDSYPADEPNRRCPDIRKARTQLGYAPHVALDEGLRRFFDWAGRHYTGEQ